MIRLLTALILILGPAPATANPIEALLELPVADRTDAAMALKGPTPLVVPDGALFVWRGEADTVRLAGDMTAWKPGPALTRIPGTEIWWLHFPCPRDARLDYKLVVDDRWILDPWNPRQMTGGFGPNSELVMPGWPGAPELDASGLPPVTIHDYPDPTGAGRPVKVLLPPGYDPDRPRLGLLVHDGFEFIELGALAGVLAWLAVHEPDLDLPLCVCVPPQDRKSEYAGAKRPEFTAWLVEELIPFVEQRYAVSSGRSWGSLGASNGGNISLELALAYPERIGRVLAMSPYVSPEVRAGFPQLSPPPRLYLNWGRYDIPRLLPIIEGFLADLESLETPVESEAFNEGHSWGLWRSTLVDGLRALYAPGR